MHKTLKTLAMNNYRYNSDLLRNIPPVMCINFPVGIDPEVYEVSGYFQGNNHSILKGLTKEHFDTISYLRESPCVITKQKIVHAIGYRSKENQTTILTLTRK